MLRTLTYSGGGEHYIFVYAPGQESRLKVQLALMAADKNLANFKWIDAARCKQQLEDREMKSVVSRNKFGAV